VRSVVSKSVMSESDTGVCVSVCVCMYVCPCPRPCVHVCMSARSSLFFFPSLSLFFFRVYMSACPHVHLSFSLARARALSLSLYPFVCVSPPPLPPLLSLSLVSQLRMPPQYPSTMQRTTKDGANVICFLFFSACSIRGCMDVYRCTHAHAHTHTHTHIHTHTRTHARSHASTRARAHTHTHTYTHTHIHTHTHTHTGSHTYTHVHTNVENMKHDVTCLYALHALDTAVKRPLFYIYYCKYTPYY
jgi:hypothetical protein